MTLNIQLQCSLIQLSYFALKFLYAIGPRLSHLQVLFPQVFSGPHATCKDDILFVYKSLAECMRRKKSRKISFYCLEIFTFSLSLSLFFNGNCLFFQLIRECTQTLCSKCNTRDQHYNLFKQHQNLTSNQFNKLSYTSQGFKLTTSAT